MSNLVIVESKNDKIFMQAMVEKLNCDIQVASPIYIDDYQSLEGLSETELTKALKNLERKIDRKDIEKIGIIIDIDNCSEQERLQFVDKCIKQVFEAESLSSTKQFIDICTKLGTNANLACYFTNVGGRGELETLLKEIKAIQSPYADCLNSWQTCIESQGKEINQKEFDKFWVSIYLRYDTCSNQEQKQAGKKCSMSGFDYVMEHKKDIWDWNNPALDDLKEFFRLFC
ncbi:DUF3226 domain-containing protein [Microcoleus sp. herbarium12]|uniref:DUF3226 domain-containing protein n=1 Tax=Microcoleus sp. herbarium12 TaxID=3055437 RepID=UPI002FD54D05